MDPKTRRRTGTGSRKPLSDCTNSFHSINPPQSSSTSLPIAPLLLSNPLNSYSLTLILSNQPKPNTNHSLNLKTTITHQTLVPFRFHPSKTAFSCWSDTASHKASEPCSVYSRRQSADKRKSKGKAVAAPMSCFLAVKTRYAMYELDEGGITKLSKSCTEAYKKKRRQTNEDGASHVLPQDFIEQQRAYFAEIDAFELPEEEVTSVHDLD